MQDECQTKKRRFPTNFAEAVEFAQELIQSLDAPVNAIQSSEVSVTPGEDATALTAELE